MPLSGDSQSQPHRHLLWTAKIQKKWQLAIFSSFFCTAMTPLVVFAVATAYPLATSGGQLRAGRRLVVRRFIYHLTRYGSCPIRMGLFAVRNNGRRRCTFRELTIMCSIWHSRHRRHLGNGSAIPLVPRNKLLVVVLPVCAVCKFVYAVVNRLARGSIKVEIVIIA